jgi:hypothetical protein
MDQVPGEIAARIAALEAKVAELYRHLDLVEPSDTDAVAEGLPVGIAALARAGKREEAIRAVIEEFGVSTVDASARVNGYLRSIGH